MSKANLFGDSSSSETPRGPQQSSGAPRLVRADRRQMRWIPRSVEQELPADHRARDLWALIERLDLSAYHDEIRARGANAGRPAIDPAILLALWVFAISEGVGSARRIERLCREHVAYRPICGGTSVCHKTLSSFRSDHGDALDRVLTDLIASALASGIVTLKEVAQDGTRVRASAGQSSFHRRPTLQKSLRLAKKRVRELKRQIDDGDPTSDRHTRSAELGAANARVARVCEALINLQQVEQTRRKSRKKTSPPRASSTDPEARIMRMSDGGYRPGYNCQLAVDTDSRFVVAARVSNSGGDMGQVDPTLDEIERRTGRVPERYLIDGGLAKPETIDNLTARGVVPFAPLPRPPGGGDPHAPRERDNDATAAWRRRMETPEAAHVYKNRAATVETVNADLKAHRGFERLLVRGMKRAQCVLLLSVLAYNLLTLVRLAPDLAST